MGAGLMNYEAAQSEPACVWFLNSALVAQLMTAGAADHVYR